MRNGPPPTREYIAAVRKQVCQDMRDEACLAEMAEKFNCYDLEELIAFETRDRIEFQLGNVYAGLDGQFQATGRDLGKIEKANEERRQQSNRERN